MYYFPGVKWLLSNGFTPFYGDTYDSYENVPLNQGGIHLEIVGDVAEIWCPSKKFWDIVPLNKAVEVVQKVMKQPLPADRCILPTYEQAVQSLRRLGVCTKRGVSQP